MAERTLSFNWRLGASTSMEEDMGEGQVFGFQVGLAENVFVACELHLLSLKLLGSLQQRVWLREILLQSAQEPDPDFVNL